MSGTTKKEKPNSSHKDTKLIKFFVTIQGVLSKMKKIKAKRLKLHFELDNVKSKILFLRLRLCPAKRDFDRHGRIIPQKHSEDRKMEDRKMFVVCSLLHGKHCFDDTKLHFSVLAFVQANLTLPSEYCFKYHTIRKVVNRFAFQYP